MIQIQDVSFEYEKEQGTLSHIDLNIQQGECVVLTGESGCGKTTVTKLINGLIPHFVEGGTLSGTTGCDTARWSGSLKTGLSSDWSLQPDSMKAESLVIADQQRRGECVPGPCTHRPSSHESG